MFRYSVIRCGVEYHVVDRADMRPDGWRRIRIFMSRDRAHRLADRLNRGGDRPKS